MASDPEALPETTYRRSGKVNWLRLAPYTIVMLGVTVLMAYVLYRAFAAGWYYFIAIPAVLSLPVGLAAYIAVAGGHCRNQLVAMFVGAIAGLVLYLGYFHLHFVSLTGRQALTRVDLLPRFIQFRMQTDVVVDDKGNARPVSVIYNWLRFSIDLGISVILVAAIAAARSRRAYCEGCRQWMHSRLAGAPPGTGRLVVQALAEGDFEQLPEIPNYWVKPLGEFTMIELEYCSGSGAEAVACPVYVSVRETKKQAPGNKSQMTNLLAKRQLSRGEFLSLAARVPRLKPVAARVVPVVDAISMAAPAHEGAAAVVREIPSEWAERAFSKSMTTRQFALSLTPVFLLLAGIALIILGFQRAPQAGGDDGTVVLGSFLLGGGLLAAFAGAKVCWMNVDFLNHRYTYRLTRRIILARGDALVNPDDPEATYVTVVPRKNWIKLDPDTPSDRGFVLPDSRRKALLFEGIRERYVIPGDAVLACEVESIVPGTGLHVTVLRARRADKAPETDIGSSCWEVPLYAKPTAWGNNHRADRLRRAEELRGRILALMSMV